MKFGEYFKSLTDINHLDFFQQISSINFKMKYATAKYDEETVSLKSILFQREMSKQCNALKEAEQDLVRNVIRLRSKLEALKFYSVIRFLKRHGGQHECDVMNAHTKKLKHLF